ncbi:30S ribosomal protein S1 [Planctomycetes bacterium K23_9]|uniref:30S ribosomal protein S1 n=2 Tax=Stieleria marina TaxID=1930275 RepID=A0A517NVS3_9BACT|nr:30S ribosomal protein S1 [Planctomycetes bacterium K23_9]
MTTGDQTPESSDVTETTAASNAAAVETSPAQSPAEPTAASATAPTVTEPAAAAGKPAARPTGPLAARGLGVAKPASPSVSPELLKAAGEAQNATIDKPKAKPGAGKKKQHKVKTSGVTGQNTAPKTPRVKVAVPSLRQELPDDIQAELDAELAAADFDAIMSGPAGMPERKEPLEEGQTVHGQVIKIQTDTVFLSLGGPDQGTLAFEQFTGEEPVPGQSIEVVVRGLNSEDGLYALSLPGSTVAVADLGDIDEGAVVTATVTGHNKGGLECKVGGVSGFMPISQITEYRVEDLSEFVDQKMVCLVTEANAGRGNLVLSRRAILEREREVKRKEQLEKMEPGDQMDGVVRTIKDFGAFVDLGGCDGLIHISKLSWDRIKHPSELLEMGQQVSVVVDSVDKETGKISLSYRDLQENPWDTAEAEFAVGTNHKGSVTRIAAFGCFVRLAAGVEGLVHISEMAHHRVSRIDSIVSEGEEVEVKVLSFDRDAQKIGLSIKAAQHVPESEGKKDVEEVDEPPREPVVKATHSGPLKGGNNASAGGEKFGLRW